MVLSTDALMLMTEFRRMLFRWLNDVTYGMNKEISKLNLTEFNTTNKYMYIKNKYKRLSQVNSR